MKALRIIAFVLILALLAGPVPELAPPAAAMGAPPVPLAELLGADGTLDLSSGYRGSIDARGWALVSEPDQPPRFAPQAVAEAGDEVWADDFTVPGVDDAVFAVASTADGTVYVGGRFSSAGGVNAKSLAKWHPDTGWAEVGGGVEHGATVNALALDSAGNLYVGGSFDALGDATPVGSVAMWDGANWSDLGGGVAGGTWGVYDLLVTDAGNLYAAGDFSTAGGTAANNIAMWNGAVWSALGAGTGSTVFALDMDQHGTLYAGGSFSTAGGSAANKVAQWDGVSWSALGSGLNERVFDLAVDHAGNVAVVGGFTQAGGQPTNSVAYWTAATSTWSTMDGGTATGWADAVAIDALGNVYVGGRFTSIGGVDAAHIAVWDGNTWADLGGGMDPREGLPSVEDLAFASDGTLLAGGSFNTAGGINVNGLAVWDGAQWSTIGQGVDNTLGCLYVDGDTLYAGVILAFGENVDSYLLHWDGTGWSELGGGTNGSIQAMTMDTAGNLYIGGWFNRVAYNTDSMVEAYNIAMWDGANWSAMDGGTGVYGKPVYALEVDGSGNVYAGGTFDTIGGVAADNVAVWDGSDWAALGTGVNERVYALLWDSGTLYVGGAFTQAGGSSASYIATWDGGSWSALGSGTSGEVKTLVKDGSDLYVGGWFTNAGGSTVNYVARWDGANWFPLGSGMDDRVDALALGTDGTLYAGGQFSEADGQSAWGVARWDGANWSPLGSGVEARVTTMAFDADENLYIGGYFTTAGGKPSSHIAYARLAPYLALTKSAQPAGVPVGDAITYTLVAQNDGAETATGVVLSDTVPADTTLDAGSLSGDAATTGTTPGSVITWDTGADLDPGQALTRTFIVHVTGGTSIANIAYVGAANVSGSNASNQVQTPVWVPSLALAKQAADAVQPGHTLETELILQNDGTMPLTGVLLTDTVPSGTTFAAASNDGILGGDTVTWTVGPLAVGETVTRTCTVTVGMGTAHGTLLTNTAGAYSVQGATATAVQVVTVDALAPTFPTTDPGTGTALITPTLGVTLTTAYPSFDWHPADGTGSSVLGYTLVITASGTQRRAAAGATSIWTTEAGYTMTTPLANGVYTWSVQAHDAANNISEWVVPATFAVDAGYSVYLPLLLKQ